MPEPTEGRVAVYIDFDNIVISRYDQIHGRGLFLKEKVRALTTAQATTGEPASKLDRATVDIGAVLDFASSFGSIVISCAYADWSLAVNAGYKNQLMERAVDLVQLFPSVRSGKNGADIRLAVDVVEDLFRLPDLTHVVIVAGDSDYIALAQRSKRLGRYVVGIGVAGSTSKALAAACDEFADYDALPGVNDDDEVEAEAEVEAVTSAPAVTTPTADSPTSAPGLTFTAPSSRRAARKAQAPDAIPDAAAATADQSRPTGQQGASKLLVRALRLGQAKDDADWLISSAVKNQMLRMDPSFQESALGYKNFTEFVKSRGNIVELQEDGQLRRLRLRPEKTTR